MNYENFKRKVHQRDNYKKVFSDFRHWESNCYKRYQVEKELTKQQYDDGSDTSRQQFKIEWEYVAYETVIDLYSCLNREMNENLKKQEWIGIEEPFPVYYTDFTELHEEIEKMEDDVEFAYAIFFIIRNMDREKGIYIEYAGKLYENIWQLDLEEYVKWADCKPDDKKVFIAMSFASEMEPAREAIRAAVKQRGYTPVLIDEKTYNGQIVDEIYAEIEESRFVIADLTQQKAGVYYEAGYAKGVKKPLILCCNDAEKEKIHFDVAQINTIFWKDAGALKNQLVQRIAGTII